MNKQQIEYVLTEVRKLTFENPFGHERAERESRMLQKLGSHTGATHPLKRASSNFRQLLPWICKTEAALLKRLKSHALEEQWKDHASCLAFFALYHEVANDLDLLISAPDEDNRQNRQLYSKIQQGVAARHRLIEGMTDRIWNQPDHLFACFYQLRRAFHYIHSEIIGDSTPIRRLRMQVWESVFTKDMMSYQQWMYHAVGRFPTLILGPSGSGKEIVARAIGLSRFIPYDIKAGRFEATAQTSFHPVNLSALSETLIESELFGHRKGAFTGANQDRAGLFASAGNYGTIFLDEIGDVSHSTQVKLLRLLQSGEYQAVGDNQTQHYSGKILAATHKDLHAEMQAGRFREDFFYRLCGDQVQTVALREILQDRPEELDNSVHYICRKLFGAAGAEALSPRIVSSLQSQVPVDYDWPGNFRELEQAVRNIVVRNEYQAVRHPLSQSPTQQISQAYQRSSMTMAEWMQAYAKQAYQQLGSYKQAAERLEVDQRTIKKWVDS
ncbi:sigma 54-interacting transcriptional regulator [Coraliomargarita sp. SDUM461004]|uniref:Sigma 54-interacting transcriptional regulator n=1 Tax=Thalassobacterium sedimentorum TaxID=3041258 RepID=A0ABU1AK32_9BACT|nr:sigma 54-interacting transcriptional regulator [Coraliomargarita sp. SDUM461004]MDQ8195170.1 sigma 54-interacting transcriptional regulator [Coraliomargarita sp. SDUM461004]